MATVLDSSGRRRSKRGRMGGGCRGL